MMIRKKVLAAFAMVGLAFLSGAGSAQSSSTSSAPVRTPLDSNGVNLATSKYQLSVTELTIGSGDSGISYGRTFLSGSGSEGAWQSNFNLTVGGILAPIGAPPEVAVNFPGRSPVYSLNGTVYSSNQGDGATLTENATSYIYTEADGTILTFDKSLYNYVDAAPIKTIKSPSGKITTFFYKTFDGAVPALRLQGVTTNTDMRLNSHIHQAQTYFLLRSWLSIMP